MSIYIAESKEEILENFNVLLERYEQNKKEVLTKSEEAQNKQNKALVKESAKTTVSEIVTGMASLQLNFNEVLDSLSKKLENETLRLGNLSQSIHIEEDKVQEIKEITMVAEASNILLHEHNEAIKYLLDMHKEKKEKLQKEKEESLKNWEEERLSLEETLELKEAQKEKNRASSKEAYLYAKERKEMVAKDVYNENKALLLRKIKEETLDKEKDWTQREKVLAEDAKALERYKKEIEEAPEKRKVESQKAREKAISKVHAEAKIEAELMQKGNKANIEVFELEILSLEESVSTQKEEILDLTEQLKKTLQQVQDLASNAVSHQPTHK